MSTAAKPNQRGGARTTGMSLKPHTLNGIRFVWRRNKGNDPIPYACGYWVDADGVQRQNSASLAVNSAFAAVEHALGPRRAVGMPVPTNQKAIKALYQFLEKGPP